MCILQKRSRYVYAIIPGPVFGQDQKGAGIPVKAVHTEEVPIYTNQSITQMKEESVYRRGTYILYSLPYLLCVIG
jgi:hypothetical protein